MEKQRKKQIKRYISWAVMALVVLVLAVMPLLASQNVPEDGPQASILSTTAQRQTIETQLIGGGQLSGSSTEDVTIPENVKITEYLVGNGDSVHAGDPIARVDKVTVMTALAEVQETLDYLSDEIADAANVSQSDEVLAQAGGLVKILYGEKGDSVRDIMLEHGALAVLSLDGRMAVDIERSTDFSYGTIVSVILSDDTEVEGRVESSAGGILTVSVEDDGYAIGEKVTVETEDGTRLGSGELYIHSPWNAAAYDGTISKVNVKEGDTLKTGKKLYELEVSGNSAQFKILQSQRQEYEELMQELFAMYHSGFVTAPCDGLVTGVDTDGAFLLASAPAEEGWFIQLLSNIIDTPPADSGDDATGGEPEGDGSEDTQKEPVGPYTVLVGQVTAAAEGTLILKAYPETLSCGSLSEIRVDTSLMTANISRNISGVTVLQKDLSTPYTSSIVSGDILYFVTDANGASFVVWAENQSVQSGSEMEGQMSSGMGSMGGAMGGAAAEPFEPYTLETLTIASVTSQEEMTLEITVDEQDIAKITKGWQATVTVEALTGQFFPAEITSIGNTGTNDGGSSKFTAKLTLSKSGDMLPGMNATAYLTLGAAEDVLCIPAAALVEEGTRTVVYTGYDEKNETLTDPVEVTTGVSDGEYVEILSGLTENDTVWYAYYDTYEASNTPERGGFGF